MFSCSSSLSGLRVQRGAQRSPLFPPVFAGEDVLVPASKCDWSFRRSGLRNDTSGNTLLRTTCSY